MMLPDLSALLDARRRSQRARDPRVLRGGLVDAGRRGGLRPVGRRRQRGRCSSGVMPSTCSTWGARPGARPRRRSRPRYAASVGRGERPGRELYLALREGPEGRPAPSARAGLAALLGRVDATRSQKRILGSSFVWDGADESIPVENETRDALTRAGRAPRTRGAPPAIRSAPPDFEGWPISFAGELEPHYARAAEWLAARPPRRTRSRAPTRCCGAHGARRRAQPRLDAGTAARALARARGRARPREE